MRLLWKLRDDETGAVFAVEVMLFLLVIGLGMIAGLAALRDAFVQELGDAGLAVNNLNQSYTITTVTNASGTVNGSTFDDNQDAADGADPVNLPPAGIDLDGNNALPNSE